MNKVRCSWAKGELDIAYHDTEWGRKTHDERELFEYLILEGMQAGLSWSLILKKRENFKRAFDNFDYNICANYSERKNAIAFIKIQEEFGSFDKYIWNFTNYKTINSNHKTSSDVPSKTELSDAIGKDMKKRGFTFVGSTIIYSYMQAIGMINDHTVDCFCHKECCE